MREEHLPGPTKAEWTAANPANTGEVIKAGVAVGADTAFMDDAWWGPTCRPPGEPTARMLVIEKSLPGCMFVGKDGKRFTDEAAAYIEIVKDMHKAQAQGRDVTPAWMVFGAHYRKKYPVGPVLPGSNSPDFMLNKSLWDNFIYKADTLEELAAKIGVDVAGLKESTAKMNEFAKTGVDTEYGKGSTEYDRFYGDPEVEPNPCLAPIEGPFYAVEIYPGELGTKGGLKADERGRVLTKEDSVIPGLYVTGNCSGALMGPTYAGAGSTIGPSMTFGWIAASDMMGQYQEGEIPAFVSAEAAADESVSA
jgi:3-oxosteroid 1-dehydrogenase